MSDISPETIEAALKALMSIDREDRHGCGTYANDDELLADAWTVIDWAVARLAADRADRDERARPIDAEWLESMFDEEFDEAFSSRSIMLGVLVPARGRCGWTWVIGDVHVATVTTRGQLLDLLRVLKGGA